MDIVLLVLSVIASSYYNSIEYVQLHNDDFVFHDRNVLRRWNQSKNVLYRHISATPERVASDGDISQPNGPLEVTWKHTKLQFLVTIEHKVVTFNSGM